MVKFTSYEKEVLGGMSMKDREGMVTGMLADALAEWLQEKGRVQPDGFTPVEILLKGMKEMRARLDRFKKSADVHIPTVQVMRHMVDGIKKINDSKEVTEFLRKGLGIRK